MATTTRLIEVFDVHDLSLCQKVTSAWLQDGEPIAIDAEGLHLGATGRLTLLQAASRDGKVILFDVINPDDILDLSAGKRLIEEGGVKDVLESNSVLKVLFYLFGCYEYNIFNINLFIRT